MPIREGSASGKIAATLAQEGREARLTVEARVLKATVAAAHFKGQHADRSQNLVPIANYLDGWEPELINADNAAVDSS